LDTFRPFSVTHAAVLLLFAAATALLIRFGRRHRGTPRLLRLERRLGAALLLLWIVGNGWWLLPSRFDPARSLPLQVCDVTSLAAAVVLLAPVRPARAVLYFWGISLSVQALITPDLGGGVATVAFWLFWVAHASAVCIAAYDVAARGLRPTWHDYRVAVAAGVAYLAVVLAVDVAFGFNYGYVGDARPGQPSLIDFLGPWPERVAIIAVLVAAVMALLMLPWELARRGRAAAPSANVGRPV
jgi:hypothetical integral membrane protein (TIGR02206 family)